MSEQSLIPTEEEIRQLPRWAQVAFAARCARRVQWSYWSARPVVAEQQQEANGRAILIAELAATTRDSNGLSEPYATETSVDIEAAAKAVDSSSLAFAAYTAKAAFTAANAAFHDAKYVAANVANAVTFASIADPNQEEGIQDDYELLLRLTREQNWTDETPVPPNVFTPLSVEQRVASGKLSAEGKTTAEFVGECVVASPAGAKPSKLRLRIAIPENVDLDALEDDLVDLYAKMDDYHRARGGAGLTLDEFKRYVREFVGAEV